MFLVQKSTRQKNSWTLIYNFFEKFCSMSKNALFTNAGEVEKSIHDPDLHQSQNLTNSSPGHAPPLHQISQKSVQNFWVILWKRDRQFKKVKTLTPSAEATNITDNYDKIWSVLLTWTCILPSLNDLKWPTTPSSVGVKTKPSLATVTE